MKTSTKRTLTATAFLLLVIAGMFVSTGLGTPSSFGWGYVASVCPAGVLFALAAGRTVPWGGVLCMAITVVLTLLLGRAFCGWVCPVPLTRRVFGGKGAVDRAASPASYVAQMAVSRRAREKAERRLARELDDEDDEAGEGADAARGDRRAASDHAARERRIAQLAAERGVTLPAVMTPAQATAAARAQLPELPQDGHRHVRVRASKADLRLAVVVIGIVTALAFGFPVFCLVCPVGLTFATFVVIVQMIRTGTFTVSVIVFPAVIAVELIVLRRWCHAVCPIGALLGLVARGNVTLRPHADLGRCVETTRGVACDACYHACPEGIDLHHPDLSTHISECLKCAECVHACPAHAITMPFLPTRDGGVTLAPNEGAGAARRGGEGGE